jgi:hypothetical protein
MCNRGLSCKRLLFTGTAIAACVTAAFAVDFASPVTIVGTVEAPYSWYRAIADVTGDGYRDIVVQRNNADDGDLGYYRSNSGTSWTWVSIATQAPNGRTFAAGGINKQVDMDNDGDIDVVACAGKPDWSGSAGGSIYWYENNSSGTSWTPHLIGTYPDDFAKEVLVCDFNNDGKMDVYVAHFNSRYVRIHRQNTPTSFTKVAEFQITNLHEGADVGRIDSDAYIDIATNGYWIQCPGGDLSGGWTVRNIASKWHDDSPHDDWMNNSTKVACADITGDGRVEVFISCSENTGMPLSWYSSADPVNGSWTEHVIKPVINVAQNLQVADLDCDGDLDVVCGSNGDHEIAPSSPPLSVFVNSGSNSFTEQVLSTAGSYNAVAGDIDSDGDIDIVTANGHASPLVLYRNQLPGGCNGGGDDDPIGITNWTYKQVDASRTQQSNPEGYSYLGLGFGDLNSDGRKDIVSGRWVYLNPGSVMTGTWARYDLGGDEDANGVMDVDGDAFADVITSDNTTVRWMEATNAEATAWTVRATIDASAPSNSHGSTQGFAIAEMCSGGAGKPDIIYAGDNSAVMYQIPANPVGAWSKVTITTNNDHNGIAVGDIDNDGRIDVALALNPEYPSIRWIKNPGSFTGNWASYTIGSMDYQYSDRFAIADINGDGRRDIIVAGEQFHNENPEVPSYWFEAPANPTQGGWTRHTICVQYTSNAMDVVDIDRDGDVDIVIGEHRGAKTLKIFQNDGSETSPPLLSPPVTNITSGHGCVTLMETTIWR